MPSVLVVYYSKTGATQALAEYLGAAVRKEGVAVVVKRVQDVRVDELLRHDGVLIGSPVYYGGPAAEIKRFIDLSNKYYGRLIGKAGGAFSTSAGVHGGTETTNLAIIHAMLIHGMVVQGDNAGCHYGPACAGKPNAAARKACSRYGKQFAALVKRLSSE
jgi:NAD(P)H dehydrogenase (quinone)